MYELKSHAREFASAQTFAGEITACRRLAADTLSCSTTFSVCTPNPDFDVRSLSFATRNETFQANPPLPDRVSCRAWCSDAVWQLRHLNRETSSAANYTGTHLGSGRFRYLNVNLTYQSSNRCEQKCCGTASLFTICFSLSRSVFGSRLRIDNNYATILPEPVSVRAM